MANFYPDIYAKNIYKIDYKKLKERGIKCLIFDLDNTLVPIHASKSTRKIKELFAYLDDLEFKIIIMSNSPKKRVELFKNELNVDCAAFSLKPLKFKYKKILKIYEYQDTEIACIGDQLMTDIYGANRMNFTSILVDKLNEEDFAITHFNRYLENKILNSYTKKGIFERGAYYD